MNRRNRILLYIAIFALLLIFASALFFWNMTHPKRVAIEGDPSFFALEFENIELYTQDNVRLAGWYVQRSDDAEDVSRANPALILLHGYPTEKSDVLLLASRLSEKFSVLLLDMRYFGDSEGTFTTLGAQESKDMRVAVDFLLERGHDKIGIFGVSLGGSVALMSAAQDSRIEAVASYAGFSSSRELGYDVLKSAYLLKYPIVALSEFLLRGLLLENITVYSAREAAFSINVPTLILHSHKDTQIPFRHALILKEAFRENQRAEFYFPSAGLHTEFTPPIADKIDDFFSKALLGQSR